MRPIRAFRRVRGKSRVEKCETCGHKTWYEICPGCGENMDCRNSKVQVNIYTTTKTLNIATHSLKCLKKALPKEEYEAVMLLLGSKMSTARGRYKPTASVLKRLLKRSQKRTADIKKELKKLGGK